MLNFVGLLFSSWAFVALGDRARWVDAMVRDDLRTALLQRMRLILRLQPLGWLLTGGIVFALGLNQPFPSPSTLIAQIEFSFIIGTGIYLAFTYPTFISMIYRRRDDGLNLLPLRPAATPGLKVLASSVSFGGGFLLIALVFAIVLYAGLRVDPTHFNRALTAGVLILVGFLVILIVRYVAIPVAQLGWVVADAKAALLVALAAERASMANRWLSAGKADARRADAMELGTSPDSPFRSNAPIQFAAAVVGALVAFGLVWLFGQPSKVGLDTGNCDHCIVINLDNSGSLSPQGR